ncbi:MAG: HlyC/CorC family transporter [Kiritimatiellae bacterium]|nr:HlyC/CorC family transporter [Kiritimatiellia bacterium]
MIPLVVFIEFAALVLLLGCSAFFSSAETALFSLNPIQIHRIKKAHPAAAQRVQSLLAFPTRPLSTILIGNTIVNVAASIVGYALAVRLVEIYNLAEHGWSGEAIALPAMPTLLLIFGEVAPKRLAIARPEQMAVLYSPILPVVAKILAPLRIVLESITRLLETHFRPRAKGLTEAEFRSVVGASQEEGVLDSEERSMVDGIIRLEDIEARDVMTPRVDLLGIDLDADPTPYEEISRKARFRYLPVYEENLDKVKGFLDVRAYLLDPDHVLEEATIPPYHVPETAPLDKILARFQKDNRRVAIVEDEYGGTAGLITRGDILEEISEEVENEYGEKKPMIEPLGNNSWLVDGNASLEDINYELDMRLEEEGADRIAGWVTAQAERFPKPGETVQAQNCRATVRQVRRRRVTLVVLEKIEPPDDDLMED